MASERVEIELVPPQSRPGAYGPPHRPVDYEKSPRDSREEAKHKNVDATSTDSVRSHLLRSESARETPKAFASGGMSLSTSCRLPQGWRFGATLGAAVSLLTFIANLVVVIVSAALIRQENGHYSAVAPIHRGKCADIQRVGIVIHLVINIVSTLLLGASNYCMQCLSAPTREDIDRAHQQEGAWLDIGVPSLRNFRFIRPIKLFFWILLGLSSVPLHLVYNSTFFVSLTNNSYDIYYASDTFATGGSYEQDIFPDIHGSINSGYDTQPSMIQSRIEELGIFTNGSSFERLNSSDCIEAYAKPILHNRRNLILVVSNTPRSNPEMLPPARGGCSNSSDTQVNFRNLGVVSCNRNSSLYAINNYNGDLTPALSPIVSVWFSWICSQDEEYYGSVPASTCSDGYWQSIRANAAQWTVYGFDVEYCISESVEDECRLNVAIDLLIVVIVFNAIKFIVITIVVWKVKDSPIITMGDAAASFIRQPDTTTQGMCLVTSADITGRSSSPKGPAYGSIEPRVYRSKKQQRASAASKARWTVSIVLTSIALITILGLLAYAIQTLKMYYGRGDPKSLWDLGIGTVSPYTLISGWSIPQRGSGALVATVLIANLPQALLSILYIIINGLFTSLSLAREWSAFAYSRRALRVSHPRGAQRSTYFLQVPYRLGVPLMCASAFLHWIVSQSIFVAAIDGVDANGAAADDFVHRDTSALTCGYSPLAMIVTVLAAAALAGFAAVLGCRGLPPGMPVAGSCSVAIAAACHAPEGTAETEPVMWGAVPGKEEERDDGVVVGHCAFSNEEVDVPVEGRLYA